MYNYNFHYINNNHALIGNCFDKSDLHKEEIIKMFHSLRTPRFQMYVGFNCIGIFINGALYGSQFSYWEKPANDVVAFSSDIFHYDGFCTFPFIGQDGRETADVTCVVPVNECNKFLVSVVSILLLFNLLFSFCNVVFCILIAKSFRMRFFLLKLKLDISKIEYLAVFLTNTSINQWQLLYQLNNFVDDATMIDCLKDLTDQTVQCLDV